MVQSFLIIMRYRHFATIQPESFNVIKHVINQYDLNYIVDDKWNYDVLMLQIQFINA